MILAMYKLIWNATMECVYRKWYVVSPAKHGSQDERSCFQEPVQMKGTLLVTSTNTVK